MSEIEIKAQMYDLITQRDQIEYDTNQSLISLEKQANEIKQGANIALRPIIDKLTELHNQLNQSKE